MDALELALKLIDHYGVSIFLVVFFTVRLEKTLVKIAAAMQETETSLKVLTAYINNWIKCKEEPHGRIINQDH